MWCRPLPFSRASYLAQNLPANTMQHNWASPVESERSVYFEYTVFYVPPTTSIICRHIHSHIFQATRQDQDESTKHSTTLWADRSFQYCKLVVVSDLSTDIILWFISCMFYRSNSCHFIACSFPYRTPREERAGKGDKRANQGLNWQSCFFRQIRR